MRLTASLFAATLLLSGCASASGPWVEVAGPYTVTAIREAIEQQLA